jgi:hypothetical protein
MFFLWWNVYLTKIERIEIDFNLQEIGLPISQFSPEITFAALVMKSRRVEARSVVLFLFLIKTFKKNHFRFMLNNSPKTVQLAPPGLTNFVSYGRIPQIILNVKHNNHHCQYTFFQKKIKCQPAPESPTKTPSQPNPKYMSRK